MPERSDALVFFGATGDLAYKQIFPALATPMTGTVSLPCFTSAHRAGKICL